LEETLSHISISHATLTTGISGVIQISMHTDSPPMVSIKFILPRAMLKEIKTTMANMDVEPSRNAFIRAAIQAYLDALKARVAKSG
jgi:hypothetical protein